MLDKILAFIATKLATIGKTFFNAGNYAITEANINAKVLGPEITVPQGTYLFLARWDFVGSGAGARNMEVKIAPSAAETWEGVRMTSGYGNYAIMQTQCIRTLTAQTTVYAIGASDKTSQAGYVNIYAIRIA